MRSMENVVGLIAFVALAALVGSACDDDDDVDVVVLDGTIDEFDINGDLVVSRAEWASGFAMWDVDNNGLITSDEFLLSDEAFDEANLDGDAVITADEWEEFADDLDADGDLFIDADEFADFL